MLNSAIGIIISPSFSFPSFLHSQSVHPAQPWHARYNTNVPTRLCLNWLTEGWDHSRGERGSDESMKHSNQTISIARKNEESVVAALVTEESHRRHNIQRRLPPLTCLDKTPETSMVPSNLEMKTRIIRRCDPLTSKTRITHLV